jgi:hypothetical protein
MGNMFGTERVRGTFDATCLVIKEPDEAQRGEIDLDLPGQWRQSFRNFVNAAAAQAFLQNSSVAMAEILAGAAAASRLPLAVSAAVLSVALHVCSVDTELLPSAQFRFGQSRVRL